MTAIHAPALPLRLRAPGTASVDVRLVAAGLIVVLLAVLGLLLALSLATEPTNAPTSFLR